ncbi:MAG: hypothetical protein J7L53_07055 [Deltaproteobacteria bacterium]|nr:hypothetical protein [Deltaproteobacteria bacterium]
MLSKKLSFQLIIILIVIPGIIHANILEDDQKNSHQNQIFDQVLLNISSGLDPLEHLNGLFWASDMLEELKKIQPQQKQIKTSLPDWYDCTQEGDTMEDLFGPGNVNAITGNSAMAAGFSQKGELTLLRWPSPSYYDQVSYLTPFLTNACETRKLLYHGALENMGSFAGIYYYTDSDEGMTWFRDDTWTHEQKYLHDESNIVLTVSENKALKIRVMVYDFIVPDKNVLVRHFKLERIINSPVVSTNLIYFENLDPVNEKTPYVPIRDVLFDNILNDFSVMYHSERDVLLHFIPNERDRSFIREYLQLSQENINDLIDLGLDSYFGDHENNIYIAIGGDRPSYSHQCGLQWIERQFSIVGPQGAYYDSRDGLLSNNPISLGLSSGALLFDLDLKKSDEAELTIYFAASTTAAGALDLLDQARGEGFKKNMEETERWWKNWISRANMPAIDDPKILAVCRRSLIGIRNGYDKNTGAIVASITTQPPYSLAWPRDGVFFAYALDVAGFHDMAEKSLKFYARVQRDCKNNPDFACILNPIFRLRYNWELDGTYDMNYYADGVPGGPIFFEIDNSGLMVWMMWEHYGFFKDKKKKKNYLEEMYPAIKKTTNSLALCKDPSNNLQCWAFEDDNTQLTQGLHGAITVHMALKYGIEAAKEIGDDPWVWMAWEERKEELEEAIINEFYNEEEQCFSGRLGAGAWLIWPDKFIEYTDPRMCGHARYLLQAITPTLNKETWVGAYDAKITLALAKMTKEERELCGVDSSMEEGGLEWAIHVLMKEVPSDETSQYGEIYVIGDFDGDGEKEFQNRVAVPHLWEGALNYLSAMAFYGNLSDYSATAEDDTDMTTVTGNDIPVSGEGSDSGCFITTAFTDR